MLKEEKLEESGGWLNGGREKGRVVKGEGGRSKDGRMEGWENGRVGEREGGRKGGWEKRRWLKGV